MTDLLLSGERRESARRFSAEADDTPSLHRALTLAAAMVGATVEIDWFEPQWVPGGRWGRSLRLTVRRGAAPAASTIVVVPWLVDSDAAAAAPAGIVIGGGAGTYWGRPREHDIRLVRAPGTRYVHWDQADAPDGVRRAVEITHRWGPALRLTLSRSGAELRLGVKGVRINKAQRRYGVSSLKALLPSDVASRRRRAEGLAPTPEVERLPLDQYLPSLSHLWWLDDDEGSAWHDGATLLQHVDALRTGEGGFEPLLDIGGWRQEHLHDQLAREIHRLAIATVASIRDPRLPLNAVAAVLASSIREAVERVVDGRDGYPASSSALPTNTVARLERARTATFLGPFGLEGYRGRIDLRVLPTSWAGVLCPVQTPESEKVGLVRFRSLADAVDTSPAAPLAGFSAGASLVPFIDHDDPTRASIAAKMMQQAVLVAGSMPPRVRSGAEEWIAEHAGAVRAPRAGRVTRVQPGLVVIDDREPIAFGPAEHDGRGRGARWTLLVEEDDWVDAGQLIAHAPDVVVPEDGPPVLALGVDAVVALRAWRGWNFEDAIVVSRSFSLRMGSEQAVRIDAPVGATSIVEELVPEELVLPGELIEAGTELFAISDDTGGRRVFRMPGPGRIVPHRFRGARPVSVRRDGGRAWVDAVIIRPLAVGDKLTTRHGGKGVVSLIEDDAAMPVSAEGLRAEVVLNPLGIVRRLNVGTLMELALGRLALDDGTTHDAPRRLGEDGRRKLVEGLNGREPGFGMLHLLKLDHLAAAKAVGRFDSAASPLTFQPLRAATWGEERRQGSPQRLGEMELWGLLASGADSVIADLLHHRGEGERSLRDAAAAGRALPPAGLRAVIAHLAIGGAEVEGLYAPEHGSAGSGWHNLTMDPDIDLSRITDLRASLRTASTGAPGFTELVLPTSADLHSALDAAWRLLDDYLEEGARSHVADSGSSGDPGEERPTHSFPISSQRHPWGSNGEKLDRIVLPPRRLLRVPEGTSPRRSVLRRRVQRVIALEIVSRAERSGSRRPAYQAWLRKEQIRSVNALLGSLEKTERGSVADRLQGKGGLLRRNLLGSSAVRSARAVLVGDPTIGPEEVHLPRWMLDQLGVPPADGRPHAGRDPDDTADDVVLVNRQPTLLPYTLIALRASEGQDDAVRLHPHHVAALAGDFDGDTVAVHRPITDAARRAAWATRRPAAALRSAGSGELIVPLGLDIALGASCATRDSAARAAFADRIAVILGRGGLTADTQSIRTAVGDAPLDTPQAVRAAAGRLVAVHGEASVGAREAALRTLVSFETACFESASTWCPSVIDLPTGPVAAALEADPDVALAALAGVLGKQSDLAQLLDTRGAVALPTAVQGGGIVHGSYLDGLDAGDYPVAAQSALAGLAAKKLVTPFAGALTRSLVTRAYEQTVAEDDCGAGAGHGVLDCPPGRLCREAYGHDRETGLAIAIGRRVGILAAMVIGERSTQLAMKSIHDRSGSADALFGTIRAIDALLLNPHDDALTPHERAAKAVAALEGVDPVHFQVVLRVSEDPDAGFAAGTIAGRLHPLLTPRGRVEFDGAEEAQELRGGVLQSLLVGSIGLEGAVDG